MLNVIYEKPELQFVREMIYKIVAEYLSSLRNNVRFDAVISCLKVKVDATDKISGGVCEFTEWPEYLEWNIKLHINPSNSKKYIAFIIAHEFAHLLMLNVHDILCLSGKARDGTNNYTAVIRMMPDGARYGEEFEELIADYLAHYIVAKLNFTDENAQYESFLKESEFDLQIIRDFEKPFGKPLFDCNFIDEQYGVDGEIRFNIFWSSILSFSFNNVVDDFDEVMGIGEFHCFNNELAKYYADQSEDNKKIVSDILKRFLKKSLE